MQLCGVIIDLILGRSCNTAVECMPHYVRVVGLNPTRGWAFFLFSFLNSISRQGFVKTDCNTACAAWSEPSLNPILKESKTSFKLTKAAECARHSETNEESELANKK